MGWSKQIADWLLGGEFFFISSRVIVEKEREEEKLSLFLFRVAGFLTVVKGKRFVGLFLSRVLGPALGNLT